MFLQYLKVGGRIYRDWTSADYQYASFVGLVITIGVVVDQHYEIQTCRSPNFIHGSPWLIKRLQRLGGQLPGEWLLSLQANATWSRARPWHFMTFWLKCHLLSHMYKGLITKLQSEIGFAHQKLMLYSKFGSAGTYDCIMWLKRYFCDKYSRISLLLEMSAPSCLYCIYIIWRGQNPQFWWS